MLWYAEPCSDLRFTALSATVPSSGYTTGGHAARSERAMVNRRSQRPLAAMFILLGCCAAHQTCEETFPSLGPSHPVRSSAHAGATTMTLSDVLQPETISWWLYTVNTLSNTVPCAVPWSCREEFLATWDPDLFDWNGGRK